MTKLKSYIKTLERCVFDMKQVQTILQGWNKLSIEKEEHLLELS
jgi:hypothetical protein